MKVLQIFINKSFQNFNYIVYSEKSKVAIHFDPYDIGQTLDKVPENVTVKYLINTHKHWDHVKDNENLIKATGCDHKVLMDGERFYISDDEYVEALSTPGHVDDHICYLLVQNEKTIGIIAGDTLFNAGVGNCKNGGNVEDLYLTTTQKIRSLEDHIKVYPSHDYMMNNLEFALTVEPDNQSIKDFIEKRKNGYFVTSMEEEKMVNPFLRTNQKELQQHFPNLSEKELFIELRNKRDKW